MSVRVQHRRDSTTNVEANTPAAGELWFDTTKKEMTIGDGALAGGIRVQKKNLGDILIPAQIVVDTNDYSPTGMKHARTLIISTDAARDITGLVPTTVGDTTDGREITIYNGGTNNARLVDQSASSSAVNRFDFGGQDMQLAPKRSVTLRYRTAGGLNRWELDAQTIGAGVGSGAVIAMTLAASSQGMSMINGVLSATVAGGALTIAIKTLAGNNPSALDPVHIVIRDPTLANGAFTVHSLTAATSLVVSSGSSLGATNAAAFKLWVVGLNDGSTFRLGVVNIPPGAASWPLLAMDQLKSATAEGGAGGADSAGIYYANATVTSKPASILGYLDYPSGLAAAGAWNIAPTTIQLHRAGIDIDSGTRDGTTFVRDDGVRSRVMQVRIQLSAINLDTVFAEGCYSALNTCTNGPIAATYGYLEVQQYIGGSTYIQQRFTTLDTLTPLVYVRNRQAGTWGSWRLLALDASITRVLLNTLTASNSASLDDTSVFSTYAASFDNFEIVVNGLIPSTNSVAIFLEVYSGGSFQTTGYVSGNLRGGGAAASNDTTTLNLPVSSAGNNVLNTVSSGGVSGYGRFYGPMGSTAVKKFWRGEFAHDAANASPQQVTASPSGRWDNTAAITGFRIRASSGNLAQGNVKIYGLR